MAPASERLPASSRSRSHPARAARVTGRRPAELVFEHEGCRDLPSSLAREWIETDGLGGYASLSLPMCPTRRQHGLLVAPFSGNPKRHVFLARFEETLELGGRSFPLSLARYPGLWSPHGHQTLERFEASPWPKSVHRAGDVTLTREILMPGGSPTVFVRYRLEGAPGPATLSLRPLLPFREADALTSENGAVNPRGDPVPGGLRFRLYPELPSLAITVHGATHRFDADAVWYRRLEYAVDLARGYGGHEDQFSPGTLVVRLSPGQDVVVAATIGEPRPDAVAEFEAAGRRRRARRSSSGGGLEGLLRFGLDKFVARAGSGRPTVIAGYPWFYEWGRDTFLAVPGIFFSRDRVEEGGDVLEAAVGFLENGLFPNRFGTSKAESDYHSADGPLWFARAVRMYEKAGGSRARLTQVFLPALEAILKAWERGIPLAREDADGLPVVGSPEANCTWMDARVDKVPVTPRWGCPVEIGALWVFLRRYVAELVLRTRSAVAARGLSEKAKRSAASFVARFWLPGPRSLADGWHDGKPDPTVRPNMVLAASLEWSPLTRAQRKDVVATAEAELLTPRGLRTLAPSHPAYHPRYEGGVLERDRAYHQGTVWPWLLGAYVEASLLAHGKSAAHLARLRALLDGLAPAVREFGLGHLPEVTCGDPPHRPGGTFAQAWSDAEVVRAYALLGAATGEAGQ